MKTILKTILLLTALSFPVYSQDLVKISLNYSNLRADRVTYNGTNTNIREGHAVTANVDYKVYSYDQLRVGAIAEFSTNVNSSRFHQYSAGAQVSFKLLENKLEPYGKLLLGVHRTENANNSFLKTLGIGFDVNINKYLAIRPIQFDKQFIDNFAVGLSRISTGVVIRFGGTEYEK